MAAAKLGGRPRARLTATVRARQEPCRLCGYPIDHALNRMGKRHPLSSTVDEWYPRALGGDPHDPTNCVDLHSVCNAIKGAHWPVTPALRARCKAKVEAILNAHNGLEVHRTW